jgi:hypothetical protein
VIPAYILSSFRDTLRQVAFINREIAAWSMKTFRNAYTDTLFPAAIHLRLMS